MSLVEVQQQNTAVDTHTQLRTHTLALAACLLCSVNDADFCDESGRGPTRFIYGMSLQTAPANASRSGGDGGYHMGVYEGNEFEWLSSFFDGYSNY